MDGYLRKLFKESLNGKDVKGNKVTGIAEEFLNREKPPPKGAINPKTVILFGISESGIEIREAVL